MISGFEYNPRNNNLELHLTRKEGEKYHLTFG
jgi:hypothetical protein